METMTPWLRVDEAAAYARCGRKRHCGHGHRGLLARYFPLTFTSVSRTGSMP
jgi:hypothetical protein